MKLSLFIAGRYLISKKSQNIINIISVIALIGVAGITAAMIVVLSAMNGLSDTLNKQFSAFDADLLIQPRYSKAIPLDSIPLNKISEIEGIKGVQRVIQEEALFRYKEKQQIGIAKGVFSNYESYKDLDTLLLAGEFNVGTVKTPYAVAGGGIASALDLQPNIFASALSVYIPKRGSGGFSSMNQAFNYRNVRIGGVFSVSSEIDNSYILMPYGVLEELMDYKGQCSRLEIFVDTDANISKIQRKVKQLLGERYTVKDQFEQHELEYKIFKSEKLSVFIILSFILLIASFNIIGALIMLMIEKKEDMQLLDALGAHISTLNRIFFLEGMFIISIGCVIGLVLGGSLILLQEKFGFYELGLNTASYFSQAYPVKLIFSDILYIILSVGIIGFISTIIPIQRFSKNFKVKR